jgi:hypothetical protein
MVSFWPPVVTPVIEFCALETPANASMKIMDFMVGIVIDAFAGVSRAQNSITGVTTGGQKLTMVLCTPSTLHGRNRMQDNIDEVM